MSVSFKLYLNFKWNNNLSIYIFTYFNFFFLVSSKNVQTLKVGTKETPKKDVLCRQLKIEKKCRLQVEKSVLALSNQLTEYGSSENFTKLCEKHFSPSILTDVKSYTNCKTRNPHGYRYTNGIKQPALTWYFLGSSVQGPLWK